MSNEDHKSARRRALVFLGALCSGILIENHFGEIGSVVWFSIACGCASLSILTHGRSRSVLLMLCVLCFGSGWGQVRTRESSIHRLDLIVSEHTHSRERVPIEVSGTLTQSIRTIVTPYKVGDPPMWKSTKTTTTIEIDRVYLSDARHRGTWKHATGNARVVLPKSLEDQSELKSGDRVEILGVFSPIGTKRNLGDLDWIALSNQSGRVGTLVVTDRSLIHRVEYTNAFDWFRGKRAYWRSRVQTRAMNAIGLDSIDQDSENSAQHAMLGALLLGQRDPAFGEVYESFQRVGVAHVLAISGFHLALVIMLGVLFLRFVGEFPKCEALIIIAILFMGVLVVPMRPPIVRAGIIVIAFMLSGHAGRRYDRLTILAWVGAGLLLWRPLDVYSLGYQLSMGITALLILLTNEQEHIALNRSTFSLSTPKNARTPTGLLHRALLSIWGTAKTNIACWIVATPTIMYHAGIVSFLSPIISLVLIPMVIVLMVLGYAQIGIGLISPELSQHTIGVVEWVANIVRQFVVLVDSIPGSSIRVRSIDPILALVATGLLVAISIGYWKPRQRRVWVVLILLASWFVIAPIVTRERAALRIDMLDVGDGSCVLIQSDGEGIIWDCGSLDRRVGKMSSRAARRAGLGRISDAIVTHDNLDHFNGLIDLVPIVGIERVWVSERMIKNPSSTWSRFQTELESLGVQIVEINIHDRIRVGEIELECLWPDPDGIEGMSGNNTSIVVRIDVPIENDNERRGTRTILLSGDIEREAMDEIMRMNPDLRVDVLELPHHGSAKPGAFGFVRTIDPGVVMQSTGASRLDDPRWDELRSGRAWYTTARRGGLWVRIGRDGEITHGWAVE